MEDNDINEQLLAKIERTERNIVRKENAEMEIAKDIDFRALKLTQEHLGDVHNRKKAIRKMLESFESYFNENGISYETIAPAMKFTEMLLKEDTASTGKLFDLLKESYTRQNEGIPDVSNHNIESDRHMKKEEIKDNKNFLKLLDQIKSAVDEIEKTEDSD